MTKTKGSTPSKGARRYREYPEFDAPQYPSDASELFEPGHPLLDRFSAIENKLDHLIFSIGKSGMTNFSTKVLDKADFFQLFKISGKTAQSWRNKGLIEYSQIKGKIYYRAEDVKRLLNRSRK